ncbi:MAG: hypothetical protein AAGG48_08130 [Planctomycetota bacterium]
MNQCKGTFRRDSSPTAQSTNQSALTAVVSRRAWRSDHNSTKYAAEVQRIAASDLGHWRRMPLGLHRWSARTVRTQLWFEEDSYPLWQDDANTGKLPMPIYMSLYRLDNVDLEEEQDRNVFITSGTWRRRIVPATGMTFIITSVAFITLPQWRIGRLLVC